jgi:hypothetical protein
MKQVSNFKILKKKYIQKLCFFLLAEDNPSPPPPHPSIKIQIYVIYI